jgi:uncharacterized protein (TIGR03435 family)
VLLGLMTLQARKYYGARRTWAQSDYPSLFSAIQEQLGLRLEAQRGPVQVLVVESAQRPTPD